MRGHLRQRQRGVWELIVPLSRDPLTGRRRQRSRTVRGTKREAERALRELLADVDAGRHTGSESTLDDLIAAWLDHARDKLSPTTAAEYRRLVERRISPALGSTPLTKLTAAQLDDFYKALSREAGLAPSSVRQIHSIIRRALRQAVRWGWLGNNPAANAEPPPVRRKEISPPSRPDLFVLIDAATQRDPSFGALVHLAAATGLRRGELCGLQWTDVDLEGARLVVRRAIVVVDGHCIPKAPKTHATRRISLDETSIEVLAAQRRRVEKHASACGVDFVDEAYVFSDSPDGAVPWNPGNVTATFRRLKANGGTVRLHDLRHAHATQLLADGVDVRTVSGRLGHANATTTLNVYAHLVDDNDREAAKLTGRHLRRD